MRKGRKGGWCGGRGGRRGGERKKRGKREIIKKKKFNRKIRMYIKWKRNREDRKTTRKKNDDNKER